MLATDELRKRYKQHSRQFNVTATKLAHFLESVESEEVLLRQRIADREGRSILSLINSGAMSPEDDTPKPSHPFSPVNTNSQDTSLSDENHEVSQPELYGEF